MEKDLLTAKQLLEQNNCTCALCQGDTVFTSTLRGVKPLLNFLEAGTDLQGFCAADKVVGKGAAFLYCLLGVRAVYAPVMSQAALEVLRQPLEDHAVTISRVQGSYVFPASFLLCCAQNPCPC